MCNENYALYDRIILPHGQSDDWGILPYFSVELLNNYSINANIDEAKNRRLGSIISLDSTCI
jgi:outer membrane protein TolC